MIPLKKTLAELKAKMQHFFFVPVRPSL